MPNDKHYPKGSPQGGQFAPKEGGASIIEGTMAAPGGYEIGGKRYVGDEAEALVDEARQMAFTTRQRVEDVLAKIVPADQLGDGARSTGPLAVVAKQSAAATSQAHISPARAAKFERDMRMVQQKNDTAAGARAKQEMQTLPRGGRPALSQVSSQATTATSQAHSVPHAKLAKIADTPSSRAPAGTQRSGGHVMGGGLPPGFGKKK